MTTLLMPADTAAATPSAGALDAAALDAAIAAACNRIAPLWPLKHFVAVNPFLGFSGQRFATTCATMRRVARTDMLMPRGFYREALANGVIDDAAIARGLAAVPQAAFADGVAGVKAALARDPTPQPASAVVATVAEVLDMLASGDRLASRTAFMVDEVSKFCAGYFDEGQSSWKQPGRNLPLYAAWRAAMVHDRNPETMGITHFRAAIGGLPLDPVETIGVVIARLGIPARAAVDYLHRALFDIGGWAAYVRYLVWDNGLYGRADDRLVQLLAIRMAWGYALWSERNDAAFRAAWASAMASAAALPEAHDEALDADLIVDLVMQEAYEAAFQGRLLARLAGTGTGTDGAGAPYQWPRRTEKRVPVHAAFCIDVRSEVYRRAFESVCPAAETIGFAGFFGYPIEYVPIGRETGGAQCPVLLTPAFTVCEAVTGASDEEETEILGLRLLRRRAAKAWKSFKLAAVSSFTFVETAGLLFAPKLVGDSAGLTRPVSDPNTDGIDPALIPRVGPRLAARTVGGRPTGFTPEQALTQAEAVLRGMSLTSGFARLVLLVGHGSTTANNPHASGLDCGACGGHTGEANARVAAGILNDPDVRLGLRAKGINIPPDTWFLGCLHDTTTDAVTIFDTAEIPADLAPAVRELRVWLAKASQLARAERAPLLGLADARNIDAAVIARSRDWAQVRPEWGLAGNAAFIAAPRSVTRGVDLGGRAFLHNYDWQGDIGFGVLTLIMTAPLVVASWINLQYYGSTVNNRAFGSGNKVLHNVVGTLGVLEGNAGDLKVGLPWQSVHDGQRFIHEPLRLNAFIAAPRDAMNAVIAGHQGIRELIENRWVNLFAIDDAGAVTHRYDRDGVWQSV